MNPNPTRTLWLSLALAVLAMFLIYSYSQDKKAEYDKKYGATKRIVVASKDILEMSTIDDSMLMMEERPVDFIQPGAVETVEEAVGMVAATPIKAKEQVLSTKLLAPGPNTGLSLQVAPNKRAVAVPIDESRGVAKLVRPGDRVDLVMSLDTSVGGKQRVEVKTLLQDVPVLAVGPNITNNIPRTLEFSGAQQKAQFRNLNGDLSFSTVTVEVNPREAQDLIYIMTASPGGLFMVLRNPNDRAINTLSTSSSNSIMGRFGDFAPEPVRAPAAIVAPPAPVQAPRKTLPKKKTGPFIDVN